MNSKYDKYLKLTFDVDIESTNTDNYETDFETNICNFCGCNCKLYITYLHEKKIKTKSCYLCHIVVNFKRYHMGKMILVKSEKSQYEINKKTMTYFNETKNIINPLDLDKNALLIEMKIYDFIELNNKIFKNCVVFFTDHVIEHLTVTYQNLFKPIKQKKYNTIYNFINMKTYNLSKEEIIELNNLLEKKSIENNEITNEIQLSIDNKIKSVYDKIKFKNELFSYLLK